MGYWEDEFPQQVERDRKREARRLFWAGMLLSCGGLAVCGLTFAEAVRMEGGVAVVHEGAIVLGIAMMVAAWFRSPIKTSPPTVAETPPSPELIELWKQIGADLSRASDTLPPESNQNPRILAYQNFLNHNEMELACDMLEEYGEERPVSREFWLALQAASVKMRLSNRAARYARRAAAV